MSKFLHDDDDKEDAKAIALCRVYSENSPAKKTLGFSFLVITRKEQRICNALTLY